jgi:hypothetical protein
MPDRRLGGDGSTLRCSWPCGVLSCSSTPTTMRRASLRDGNRNKGNTHDPSNDHQCMKNCARQQKPVCPRSCASFLDIRTSLKFVFRVRIFVLTVQVFGEINEERVGSQMRLACLLYFMRSLEDFPPTRRLTKDRVRSMISVTTMVEPPQTWGCQLRRWPLRHCSHGAR